MQSLAQRNPDSDVLSDLATKTVDDLEAMRAKRLGVDLKQGTPRTSRNSTSS